MSLSPDELAARYDDPHRKTERVEISTERFEKGIKRGDESAWGVGALVFQDGEVLFVREGEMWLLPGGRLEPDESPTAGARREVSEETGIEIEITGLGAIAEQTFVREGTDDTYEFYFATFLGKPTAAFREAIARPNDDAIDEVTWRREVPASTFDYELVTHLVETYV
jgi:ADP-ribose pyrophosphatase YjhB (NUDIX family)